MAFSSHQNRGPILALVVTILLLGITVWRLYHDYPDTIAPQRNSKIHVSVPNKQQDPEILRAAAILETRPLDNLIPLILHFSAVLGPKWPIHIFTSSSNRGRLQKAPAIVRLVMSGAVLLRELPKGVPDDFAFHESYKMSRFLTRDWFWEQMAPAEYVFLFNADSVLCSRADRTLDDFLGYDLVMPELGEDEDLSGETSLRKRNTILKIIEKSDWKPETLGKAELGEKTKTGSEALWFWRKLKEDLESGIKNVKLPTKEVMRSFAMDKLWQDKPFGYANVRNWYERSEEIINWCPEYSLAVRDE